MKPWEQLARAPVPDGPGELTLLRRAGGGMGGGDEFEIRIDRHTLMSSRAFSSEEALADLGCGHLRHTRSARVLIGGLGMGFTLRRALDRLPDTAEVVVAELIPEVVRWNRGPLAPLAGHPLDDPRTVVREGDVRIAMKERPSAFDAILLDVDNSPDGLTHERNDWLYGQKGLHAARKALRKGGVLAVWSCADSQAFTERLKRCGFDVEVRRVRARGNKGATHVIWRATVAAGGPATNGGHAQQSPRKAARRRPRGGDRRR